MSAFAIDLATLPPGWHRVGLECEAAELGLPQAEWPGPVRGDLEVEKTGDQVSVRGRLEAVAALQCVSCLRVFEWTLRAPFEIFAERSGSVLRAEEEALEGDDYMKFHDGRTLDLAEDARETMLLEVPIAPRCREDCRGLCPVCGVDRNEEACAHG
jgi:uncharacterized protein